MSSRLQGEKQGAARPFEAVTAPTAPTALFASPPARLFFIFCCSYTETPNRDHLSLS